eukprot:3048601-Rhodomonas_salina.2
MTQQEHVTRTCAPLMAEESSTDTGPETPPDTLCQYRTPPRQVAHTRYLSTAPRAGAPYAIALPHLAKANRGPYAMSVPDIA